MITKDRKERKGRGVVSVLAVDLPFNLSWVRYGRRRIAGKDPNLAGDYYST